MPPESSLLTEQKVSKQVTVAAGESEICQIPIPKNIQCFLKGYGYSWFTSNEYTLSTGRIQFPKRTDQEGSVSQPIIYSVPFNCASGGNVELRIVNNDGSSHVYDVVFFFMVSEQLPEESTGNDLIFNTGLTSQNNLAVSGIFSTIIGANSSESGFVQSVYDLDLTTFYQFSMAAIGSLLTNDNSITFDLGSIKKINSVNYAADLIITAGSGVQTDVKIQISDDDVSYTDVDSQIKTSSSSLTVSVGSQSARYVRFLSSQTTRNTSTQTQFTVINIF